MAPEDINPELLARARQMLKKAFMDVQNPMIQQGLPQEYIEQMQQEEQMAQQQQMQEQQQKQQQAQMVRQFIQQRNAPPGGQDLAAPGPQQPQGEVKMKIDTNEQILKLTKMVAAIIDFFQIPISVSDMVITPEEMGQYAKPQQPKSQGQPGQPGQPEQPPGAISPIEPVPQFGQQKLGSEGDDLDFSTGVPYIQKDFQVEEQQRAVADFLRNFA